ncbi:M50 family metallopeptidase [Parafrankia sp. FMc2]|uniref:M50 family metallopeptidase n=1 Tax=Parafrankia sp. FMc2 TaxID=3233196 RepID=UPI0034D6E6AE
MLSRSFDAQPAPAHWILVVTGVVALLTVASDRVWPTARHVVTIAHEGGHALVAVAAGRRLAGVRLHSDTSGVTVSSGRPTGPGVILTVAAGYTTPSLLGLGAAGLLATGRVTLLLQLLVALLLTMLVVVRNGFGVLSVLVSTAVVLGVSWFAADDVQAGFAAYATWFLLVGAVRPIVEVQRQRRRRRAWDSDPDQLARLTGLPGTFWVGAFGAVSLGCLAAAAAALVV